MASTSSGAPDTRGWSLEDFERYDTLGMFCRCVRARACWPARTRYQQSSRRWRAFVSCTGTGTFGRVYLVQHKPTGKYYAMKILRKKVIVRLKQVQHIQNEKDVLQSINHPFIVNMYVTRDHARALSISLDLSLSLSLARCLTRNGCIQVLAYARHTQHLSRVRVRHRWRGLFASAYRWSIYWRHDTLLRG